MSRLDQSVPAVVEAHAATDPSALALTCSGSSLTYGDLAERSARVAGFLASRSVARGDRLVVVAGNTVELPLLLLGAARLGAIAVPINLYHRGEVLRHMVSHVSPRLVLCDRSVVDEEQAATIREAEPGAVHVAIGSGEHEFPALSAGCDSVRSGGDPLDPMAIVYTSGTSGRSKGAVLSQAFMLLEADAYLQVVEARPGDVFWSALPLFHTNALCLTLMGALLSGGQAVLRPRFSASNFWTNIREDGATITNLLGAMVPILLKADPAAGASNPLRVVVGGGVSPRSAQEFSDRFGVEFREIFGLTETGVNVGETRQARRSGSVGKPLEHWEVRVEAPAGEEGEIQIRGRRPGAIFDGYWDDEDRTAEALTDDGFFRTGDRGCFDGDGFLSFRGRIKESIRRRGENISPWEVEAAFARHPEVAECAAVAVPAELGEDEVKIAYVLRPGADVSAAALHEFCRGQMATFMVPRFYEQLPELPKTATEKVERNRLSSLGGAVVDVGDGRARQPS